MSKKVQKTIVRILSAVIAIVTVFFYWYETGIFSEKITTIDFMQKIEDNQFSKVEVVSEENIAYMYEKDSKKIYSAKFISCEELENIVQEKIKDGIDAEYMVIEKTSFFAVLLSFIIMNTFLRVVIKLFSFVFSKNKGTKNKEGKQTEKQDKNQDEKLEGKLAELRDLLDPMGETKINVQEVSNVKTRFSDVIGLDNQIQEVRDIVSFFSQTDKYKEMGAKIPRGILLYGKSGTGKTLIARAVAGEAGVTFFSVSASDIMSAYYGESEKNIRRLFEMAKRKAPAIIFIDEIDSIATQRYKETGVSSNYKAGLLNTLLSCMDGFNSAEGIVVIAATNYREILDNAILRRGRFDRQIYIPAPDKEGRKKLIEFYKKGKKIKAEGITEKLASMTTGMTGADIESIMNEAAIIAVRNNQEFIEEEDVLEAYRKVVIGVKNNNNTNNMAEKRKTAIHEAGHAVVSKILGKVPVELSIISRGDAGGYNLFGEVDRKSLSVDDILNEVKISLGGRAAELMLLNEVYSGAASDLRKASELIRQMYLFFGMGTSKKVGLVLTDGKEYDSIITKNAIECMEKELDECFAKVEEMLNRNKEIVEALAQILIEKENMSSEEIEEFFDKHQVAL